MDIIKILIVFCVLQFRSSMSLDDDVCRESVIMENLWRNKPQLKEEWDSQRRMMAKPSPRSLFRGLKDCTVYYGDIIVNRYSAVDKGFEEYIRYQDFRNLRNLRIIYGILRLELGKYLNFWSLSFLPNLRKIETSVSDRPGFVLVDSYVESIGLTKVRLNVPYIRIKQNSYLCYMERFETINSSSRFDVNMNGIHGNARQCKVDGWVCSTSCSPIEGCWGPKDRHCFRCRHWRAGLNCVNRCEMKPNFFAPMKRKDGVCGRCHKMCLYGCHGPKRTQCRSHPELTDDCLNHMYFNKGTRECEECSVECFGQGYQNRIQLINRACSGPGNFSGSGGCSLRCRGMTFLTIASDGLPECSPCHENCRSGCRNGSLAGCIELKQSESESPETNTNDVTHWILAGLLMMCILVSCLLWFRRGIKILRLLRRVFGCRKPQDGADPGSNGDNVPLRERNTPRASLTGVELRVEYHSEQFSVDRTRPEVQSCGKYLDFSLRFVLCIVPGRSGWATFDDVKKALQPMFGCGNIRGIGQLRGVKDGRTVVDVAHPDDDDDETGAPGFADIDANHYSWYEVEEKRRTAITAVGDEEMTKQLRKRPGIAAVEEGGDVLIVVGPRRPALRLHDISTDYNEFTANDYTKPPDELNAPPAYDDVAKPAIA